MTEYHLAVSRDTTLVVELLNYRDHVKATGVGTTGETDFRVLLFPFVDMGKCNRWGLELSLQFQLSFTRSKSALGGPEL